MDSSIQVWRFAIPFGLAVFVVSVVLAVVLAKFLARRSKLDVSDSIWKVVLVGVIVARLAFVYQFHAGYFTHILDILNISDGGWNPQAGFIAAWLTSLYIALKRRPLLKPVLLSMGAGTLAWTLGMIGVTATAPSGPDLSATAVAAMDGTTWSLGEFRESRPW